VEEQYAQGLRKLANRHPPDDSSDLGYTMFQAEEDALADMDLASSLHHGRRL
jgi:hypothetical protein